MRRRRKNKFTWFPNIGASAVEQVAPFSQLLANLAVVSTGEINSIISPVTIDPPLEGDAVTGDDRLSDIIGNEYFLKRIVGRCFLSIASAADDPPGTINAKTALIGVGFFVARANDDASGGGINQPIGSATPAEQNSNYSTLSLDTVREPWIWHRTYILSTGRASRSDPTILLPFSDEFAASTNTQMSGLQSPHFDCKTARRVRQDDRLWFNISVRTLDNEWSQANHVPNAQNTRVFLVLDYRVLGQLRKAKATGTF